MAITSETLEKIKYYCAYQERSHREVRSKLIELKVYGNDLENYIVMLLEENFLNEERYACAIARGKFYFKKWGRHKINQFLSLQQVSAFCIKKAMEEIKEQDYIQTLNSLTEKKLNELKSEKNKLVKMTKLKNYLLQKGYEYEYINDIIKSNF